MPDPTPTGKQRAARALAWEQEFDRHSFYDFYEARAAANTRAPAVILVEAIPDEERAA